MTIYTISFKRRHGHLYSSVRGGLGGAVAYWQGVGLAIQESRVRGLAATLLRNNLGPVVHTLLPLSPSSIIWYQRKLGSKQAYRVVHQPVSRGLAVFADAWLSGWLAEISADLRETVAHQRWCFTTMRYTNPRLYFFYFTAWQVCHASHYIVDFANTLLFVFLFRFVTFYFVFLQVFWFCNFFYGLYNFNYWRFFYKLTKFRLLM